eukprot:c20162_g1_i2 orf=586-783(-)
MHSLEIQQRHVEDQPSEKLPKSSPTQQTHYDYEQWGQTINLIPYPQSLPHQLSTCNPLHHLQLLL